MKRLALGIFLLVFGIAFNVALVAVCSADPFDGGPWARDHYTDHNWVGVDVLAQYGYGTADSAAINTAIAAEGSVILWLEATSWTIDADVALSAGQCLVIPRGATLAVSTGVTLTACVDAGNYAIFSMAGTAATVITGAPDNRAPMTWWGTNGAALEYAIDSVDANDLFVYVPAGTYTCTGLAATASDVRLVGDGKDKSIISAMTSITTSGGSSVIDIQGVKFLNCTYAVIASDDVTRMWVRDSWFYGCAYGIFCNDTSAPYTLDVTDVVWERNVFEEKSSSDWVHGLGLQGVASVDGVLVADSEFKGMTTTTAANNVKAVSIGQDAAGSSDYSKFRNITVRDNVFSGLSQSGAANGLAFAIRVIGKNVTITGNKIRDMINGDAIYAKGEGIIISNNRVTDPGVAGITVKAGVCDTCTETRDSMIEGNTIDGALTSASGYAIRLYGSGTISNNRIRLTDGSGIYTNSPNSAAAYGRVAIMGNFVEGVEAGIYSNIADDYLVNGNDVITTGTPLSINVAGSSVVVDQVNITGNNFRGTTLGLDVVSTNIKPVLWNMTGNTFDCAGGAGTAVEGIASATLIVSGNTFHFGTSAYGLGLFGIDVNNTSINVSGNTFRAKTAATVTDMLDLRDISITGPRATVIGNVFETYGGTITSAIAVDADYTNLWVKGNTFRGTITNMVDTNTSGITWGTIDISENSVALGTSVASAYLWLPHSAAQTISKLAITRNNILVPGDGTMTLFPWTSYYNDTVTTSIIEGNTGINHLTATLDDATLPLAENYYLDSSSVHVDVTIGSGHYVGQDVTFRLSDASNGATLTVGAHEVGNNYTATFATTSDYLTLKWDGLKWVTVSGTADGPVASTSGTLKIVQLLAGLDSADMAVGYFTTSFSVPEPLSGWTLATAEAHVLTPGTDGTGDVTLYRRRAGSQVEMLSADITITSGDYRAEDGTINTSNDDLLTGDSIVGRVTAVHTTIAAKGAGMTLTFRP
ncbi:MAG: right-handed parallel beta-helix repeat-containing protein [Pseudomonadota bacterium]